jgi:deoxyribodipyrimidine photo-lyase
MTTIVWFRQDLRTHDNPALAAAAERGRVLPLFILDNENSQYPWALGGASRWWLHHSLSSLEEDLGYLALFKGDPRGILPTIIKQVGAKAVYWNRCYEPFAIERDSDLKASLQKQGVEVQSFNGSLLHEPWEVKTGNGDSYKVFTPYWRACLSKPIQAPLPRPTLTICRSKPASEDLKDWSLLPTKPDWAAGWKNLWQPGEAGARARLDEFAKNGLSGYREMRERPDKHGSSRLSPHLHWGEISPRQIAARLASEEKHQLKREGATKFMSEIGWREFAYQLIYNYPALPEQNWRKKFDAYPWRESTDDLKAWQQGRTGYPFVDAGMRELWHTGWMHNRVRMITASFLVKHLRIDWRLGEAWFWDTLLDADLANNAAGWQWVAGSGADASPYFRIFNPIAQGHKFDPNGDYVRRWCPELARLSNEKIHAPFEADSGILAQAGITLGKTYPRPIVDHDQARRAALDGYNRVRAAHAEQGELE